MCIRDSGKAWNSTFAAVLESPLELAEREASTMQTGCCTAWKMRVLTSGWWPSGEQSITQMLSLIHICAGPRYCLKKYKYYLFPVEHGKGGMRSKR